MDVAGKSDVDACEVLAQHFHDARESASGVLVLDELEEIMEYLPVDFLEGPMFAKIALLRCSFYEKNATFLRNPDL